MINYQYCPQCKSNLTQKHNSYHCPSCNINIYINSKPASDIFLIEDDKVLLAKRAHEPFKGSWDVIGGFLDLGELPEDGVKREVMEETGLEIEILDLLGFYMDRYGDDGDHVLVNRFIGKITGGDMKANDDVAELKWFPINNLPEDHGFANTLQGFKDLQKWYKDNDGV